MTSVSVIMTCYNEGAYIGSAVRSVLLQTRADAIDRIVIVDDGSSEDTLQILRDIANWDPRIRIVFSGGNGLPAARNLAAQGLDAEWIAILDGDDLWLPEKLELQLMVAAENKDVGLIYTGVYMFENDGLVSCTVARINDLSGSKDLEWDYFLKDGPIIPSSVLMRRAVFLKAGGFDDKIKIFEDTEFFARMAKACRFGFVRDPLIQKRNHKASITAKRGEMMAHHAFVAFLVVRNNPRLQPLLRQRLSERARKLGNSAVGDGMPEAAKLFYSMAFSINPLSWRAIATLLLFKLGVPLRGMRTRAIKPARVSSHTRHNGVC